MVTVGWRLYWLWLLSGGDCTGGVYCWVEILLVMVTVGWRLYWWCLLSGGDCTGYGYCRVEIVLVVFTGFLFSLTFVYYCLVRVKPTCSIFPTFYISHSFSLLSFMLFISLFTPPSVCLSSFLGGRRGVQPSDYGGFLGSSSRASSRASSARASPVVEERADFLEKTSRTASTLSAATLASLGGGLSRRGSCDTSISADTEASIREMKDSLTEAEEKYRRAMVSNAQLDNEKSTLMYQVDTLRETLMELEELLYETRRECEEKTKGYERERHAHTVLQFQFGEMKETLQQTEELLKDAQLMRAKGESWVREISDLHETLEWKEKIIRALERQKEYSDTVQDERNTLRDEVFRLRDVLKKHGIALGPEVTTNGESGSKTTDAPEDVESTSTLDLQTPGVSGDCVLERLPEDQDTGTDSRSGKNLSPSTGFKFQAEDQRSAFEDVDTGVFRPDKAVGVDAKRSLEVHPSNSSAVVQIQGDVKVLRSGSRPDVFSGRWENYEEPNTTQCSRYPIQAQVRMDWTKIVDHRQPEVVQRGVSARRRQGDVANNESRTGNILREKVDRAEQPLPREVGGALEPLPREGGGALENIKAPDKLMEKTTTALNEEVQKAVGALQNLPQPVEAFSLQEPACSPQKKQNISKSAQELIPTLDVTEAEKIGSPRPTCPPARRRESGPACRVDGPCGRQLCTSVKVEKGLASFLDSCQEAGALDFEVISPEDADTPRDDTREEAEPHADKAKNTRMYTRDCCVS
ncbi:uncharacterized protein lrrfip1b isoform X3 [Brachyhypopomus gauderio]|uniref:uncharacterized protein lrrfip1b isoform X3 n=1 Tax=Brachyhypopomus gauderio TaxID=698409 RepID=UPI00404351B1